MRSLLVLAAVPVLLAATACSNDDPDARSVPSGPAPTVSSPAPTEPTGSADRDQVCAAVVTGINAFNTGDYEATVAAFEQAVPLAESADDGSAAADDLLAAVRYYAALAPGDYPAASASSPEFARWKVVTLGQCVAGDDTTDPGDPGGDTGVEA